MTAALDKEAFLVSMPCLVKAYTHNLDAKERIVSVEASCEEMDSEGDIILQRALLDSAPDFIKSGDLDIDHLSKIGSRYGIRDPEKYIVGRPLEVRDMGNGRTEVVGRIDSFAPFDPVANKADELWKSLVSEPDAVWRASIYGFPTDLEKGVGGAQRYLVRSMRWTSMAFTRRPVNDKIQKKTTIIMAKSLDAEIIKGDFMSSFGEKISGQDMPELDILFKSYEDHWRSRCDMMMKSRTLYDIKNHFVKCERFSEKNAEIAAHAVMNMIRRGTR